MLQPPGPASLVVCFLAQFGFVVFLNEVSLIEKPESLGLTTGVDSETIIVEAPPLCAAGPALAPPTCDAIIPCPEPVVCEAATPPSASAGLSETLRWVCFGSVLGGLVVYGFASFVSQLTGAFAGAVVGLVELDWLCIR